jgi:hypothetical protein
MSNYPQSALNFTSYPTHTKHGDHYSPAVAAFIEEGTIRVRGVIFTEHVVQAIHTVWKPQDGDSSNLECLLVCTFGDETEASMHHFTTLESLSDLGSFETVEAFIAKQPSEVGQDNTPVKTSRGTKVRPQTGTNQGNS